MTKKEKQRRAAAQQRYRARLRQRELYERNYRIAREPVAATGRLPVTASDLMHMPPEKLLRALSRPDFTMTGVR